MLQQGDCMCKLGLKKMLTFWSHWAKNPGKWYAFNGQATYKSSFARGIGPAPRIFAKLLKASVSILKKNDDNSHIARRQTSLRDGHRQLDDKLLYGKTIDGKKHSDRLATTSRFQNKSGKICVNNNIKDQSFRSNSIFDSNDIFTYPRDIRKNISFVIGNVQDNSKLIGRLESRLSGENNWHVNRSC